MTQKFAQLPAEAKVLLGTGDALIAEAAPRDPNWGVGMGVADRRVDDPAQV